MCNSLVTQTRFILVWDTLTLVQTATYSSSELIFRPAGRLSGNGCVFTDRVTKINEGSNQTVDIVNAAMIKSLGFVPKSDAARAGWLAFGLDRNNGAGKLSAFVAGR